MGTITPLRFPGAYEDEHGREEISRLIRPVVDSQGQDTYRLHTVIRGVEVSWWDFEGLEAPDRDAATAAGLDADLSDCRLSGRIPSQVVVAGERRPVLVEFSCELRGETVEDVLVSIEIDGTAHRGTGQTFEDSLRAARKTFPAGTFLMSCHTCRWSGWRVFDAPVLGLRCCRDGGRQHLDARTKGQHWRVPVAELVPDTHLCDRYERA